MRSDVRRTLGEDIKLLFLVSCEEKVLHLHTYTSERFAIILGLG
jgi:hypothetical protein